MFTLEDFHPANRVPLNKAQAALNYFNWCLSFETPERVAQILAEHRSKKLLHD